MVRMDKAANCISNLRSQISDLRSEFKTQLTRAITNLKKPSKNRKQSSKHEAQSSRRSVRRVSLSKRTHIGRFRPTSFLINVLIRLNHLIRNPLPSGDRVHWLQFCKAS